MKPEDRESRRAQRLIDVMVAAGELVVVTDPGTGERYYVATEKFRRLNESLRGRGLCPVGEANQTPAGEISGPRGRGAHAAPKMPTRARYGLAAMATAGILALSSSAAGAALAWNQRQKVVMDPVNGSQPEHSDNPFDQDADQDSCTRHQTTTTLYTALTPVWFPQARRDVRNLFETVIG